MERGPGLVLAVGLVLASSSAAKAQSGGTLVPPELLQGSRLVLADSSCSVDAPDPAGWEWLELPAGAQGAVATRSFVCRNPRTGEFQNVFVETTKERPAARLTLATATDFVRGMAASMGKSGHVEVGNFVCEPSSVPRPNESFHYTFDFNGNHAVSGHVWGYVTDMIDANGYTQFVLQRAAAEGKEPAAFTRLARSFRLLKEPGSSPSDYRPAVALVVALFGIALVPIVAALVLRTRRRAA